MRVRFRPLHPGAVAAHRGGGVFRAGDVVELSAADIDRINGGTPGIDGAPALVPVTGVEAAADFIAAISTPTPVNPETDAAVPAPAGPVKRTRGKRGG
jgi:hypothetical protein